MATDPSDHDQRIPAWRGGRVQLQRMVRGERKGLMGVPGMNGLAGVVVIDRNDRPVQTSLEGINSPIPCILYRLPEPYLRHPTSPLPAAFVFDAQSGCGRTSSVSIVK